MIQSAVPGRSREQPEDVCIFFLQSYYGISCWLNTFNKEYFNVFLLLVFRRYLETFYITEQCPRFQYRTITIEQYRTITIEVTALYCLWIVFKDNFRWKIRKGESKTKRQIHFSEKFLMIWDDGLACGCRQVNAILHTIAVFKNDVYCFNDGRMKFRKLQMLLIILSKGFQF